MKKVFLGMTFFLLTALALPTCALSQSTSNDSSNPGVYGTRKVYQGIYAPDRLYYRYPKTFWRGSVHPGFLNDVTCSRARIALERYGQWTGALDPNGSCGNGDPKTWATGNFVNYWMSESSN